jgi:hypothetical protein
MQRDYVLEKTSINKLNGPKTKKQLLSVKKEAEANESLGITAKIKGRLKPVLYGEPGQTNYRYTINLLLTTNKEGEKGEEVLDLAEKTIRKAAELQKWRVVGEAAAVEVVAAEAQKNRPPWILPQMTDQVLAEDFPEIIDREAHLRTIHRSTEMFMRSEGAIRSHTILYGEPGACKTNMILALKRWYEKDSEVERVHLCDVTTISKAGLENWILDRAESGTLPEILALEEIEKYDMNVLLPLGSVMDGRGVLTKVNAKVNRKGTTKMLIWMTCNNDDYVRKWNKGFLWSRCTNEIPCIRPTRGQMETIILPKKIASIHGNPAWAKPACDFAYDVMKTDDPRKIVGLLDGQDGLLDGSYQKDRKKILDDATIAASKKKAKTTIDRDEWA